MTAPVKSIVGEKMEALTGVRAIMKDIVETLTCKPNIVNLSAGNPVIIPEVAEMWRRYTGELMASSSFDEVICRYGSTQGYEPFIESIVDWINSNYGWGIRNENILITPGSQTLYFMAANIFGGQTRDGAFREVVLPSCPEYTGYEGVVLDRRILRSFAPTINELSAHEFKYSIDPTANFVDEHTGAVIFSRPCNPTGNILSDAEVKIIADQAGAKNVPVFIDSAYAPPFPGIAFDEFQDMVPAFGGNIVHCMSLSKVGMPGERVGIAIGDPKYVSAMEAFQSNANLHASRFGQAIAAKAIMSGELAHISRNIIAPHYYKKLQCIKRALNKELQGIPWSLHKGEGSLFTWLWLKDLPITDRQLYSELKKNDLIVVPGSAFFPGFNEEWSHKEQCLRISLTASEENIERGASIMGRVLRNVYDAAPSIKREPKKIDCAPI